jgi:tRNA-Thr(GGU) m(6)t(6)A37 methyltransferase TsaA
VSHTFRSIGVIHTPFTEKFGDPRQSLMMDEARGVIRLARDPHFATALKGLEGFSHLWIVFVFDQNGDKPWKPTIEPPREGGPRRVGVLASRSPHRPNPIGLSAVRLDRIDFDAPEGVEIHVSGVDILDGTPVLDIKPYLPYADAIPDAKSGWAQGQIPRHRVEFSPESLHAIESHAARYPRLKELITEMLEWDPRPMSQRRNFAIDQPQTEGMKFGVRILDFDILWQVHDQAIHVTDLVVLTKP